MFVIYRSIGGKQRELNEKKVEKKEEVFYGGVEGRGGVDIGEG